MRTIFERNLEKQKKSLENKFKLELNSKLEHKKRELEH